MKTKTKFITIAGYRGGIAERAIHYHKEARAASTVCKNLEEDINELREKIAVLRVELLKAMEHEKEMREKAREYSNVVRGSIKRGDRRHSVLLKVLKTGS